MREVRRVLRARRHVVAEYRRLLYDRRRRKPARNGRRGSSRLARRRARRTQPNRMPQQGLKPKDLVGIPWMRRLRVAGRRLVAAPRPSSGHKPNPMPEIGARPLHDGARILVFADQIGPLLLRRRGDQRAVATNRLRHRSRGIAVAEARRWHRHDRAATARGNGGRAVDEPRATSARSGRSRRHRFAGAHFATFPPALIEPCILAGCPAGGTVLDPFLGAGTTALVADRLGRHAIGVELSPAYAAMARDRIGGPKLARAAA